MSFKHLFFICCFFAVSGCASFRGIPSHGGGKRFDEEERLVAAATYKALDQMVLPELVDKKVRIVNEFMTTYGSGNVTFGGLQNIGLSANYQDSSAYYPGGFNSATRILEDRSATTYAGSFGYRPDMSFYSATANTDRDAAYFIACLEMKLRHSGVTPVLKDEEVTLYVLLDVLGTNLGRQDRLINHTDSLSASCEFTYYAVDAKTGKLLFESRRSGSAALYTEKSTLFTGHSVIQRSVESMTPLDMPDFHAKRTDAPAEEKTVAEEPPPQAVPEPAAATGTTPKKRPYWQYSIGFLQRLLTIHKTEPEPAVQPAPEPGKPIGNGDTEDEQIKVLESRALQLIQTGNSNQAAEVIQQIRAIDPSADALEKIAVMQAGQ